MATLHRNIRWIAIAALTFSPVLAMASDPALPTARQVVERYDQALGGRDAIMRHTSSTMKGMLEIPQGPQPQHLPFVFLAHAPFQRVEKTSLPNGAGDVLNAFDGENAWSFDPRSGAQVYDGDEKQSMKRDADFYYAINELSWFKSMETVGAVDFEGKPCFHLHGVNNWGKSNDHFYDRETGLLDGYEFASELGLTHEIFSDYKKIDGVMVPTRQTVKVQIKTGEWVVAETLIFESVTFNDVDPAVFIPLDAVKALLKKQAQ